jgi:hypothetical protein
MPEHNDVKPAAQVLRQLARITIVAGLLLAVGAVLILTVELILWSLLQNNQRTIVMLDKKLIYSTWHPPSPHRRLMSMRVQAAGDDGGGDRPSEGLPTWTIATSSVADEPI